MPTLNPAYIGIIKPNNVYEIVIMSLSISLGDNKKIKNNIKVCKDTFISLPSDIDNIDPIHSNASNNAFLVNRLISTII